MKLFGKNKQQSSGSELTESQQQAIRALLSYFANANIGGFNTEKLIETGGTIMSELMNLKKGESPNMVFPTLEAELNAYIKLTPDKETLVKMRDELKQAFPGSTDTEGMGR